MKRKGKERETISPARDGEGTLRSRRHHNAAISSTQALHSRTPMRAAATLSVKEQIARRAAKPLIQGRQFKWISPAQRMKDMSVDLALSRVRDRREMLEGEADAGDNASHSLFAHALAATAQLNLSAAFLAFSRSIEPKARSLPLVIHHRQDIITAICTALSEKQSDVELAGEHILDLVPSLITDLANLLLPSLPLLLTALLRLTAPSPLVSANPKLLERVYDVLGALFRDLGRDILASDEPGGMSDVWELVRRGLGAPARENPVEESVVTQEQENKVPLLQPTEPTVDFEDDDRDEDELSVPFASTSMAPAPAPPPSTLPNYFRTTPQTRRLLGSAFAFLVRKARSGIMGDADAESELDQLLRMMLEDVVELESVDDGVRRSKGRGAKGRGKGHGKGRGQEEGSSNMLAEGLVWVVVESCSAPNNFLHSRTPAVIRALLSVVLALPSFSLPTEVVTHVILALAQHALTPEAVDPVFDVILEVASAQAAKDEADWEKCTVVLKVVETLVGVKKGARISRSRRQKLLPLLQRFSTFLSCPTPIPAPFLDSFTTTTVGAFLLATLPDVLSSGRHILNALFTTSSPTTFGHACALSTALDNADWGLFPTAVLPLILPATERFVDDARSMELLGRLAWSGRLRTVAGSGNPSWEKTIGEKCAKTLEEWTKAYQKAEVTEDGTVSLLDVLLVVPQIPSFHQPFLNLTCDLISAISSTSPSEARSAFLSSPVNPANVLGSALLAFSRLPSSHPSLISTSVTPMIQAFAWHRGVMEGVAALSLASSPDVYAAVLPNLLSEDALLRLSSLQVLVALVHTPVTSALVQKCLEAEEMPLSVQGAREKSMKLRKIGIVAHAQLGKDDEDPTQALEIVLKYLTAMLKVNFKPLWPEAIQALALLAQRYPDAVWQTISGQLVIAATRNVGLYVSRKPEWATMVQEAEDVAIFEEAQLRCHHLEELHKAVRKEIGLFQNGLEATAARKSVLISHQVAPERLVIHSYEAQLLALFCEIPDLAQRHSRDFTEVFFGCFQREEAYATVFDVDAEKLPSYVRPDESNKERKLRLLAWLTLYSKFSNPKALYRAEELATQFRTLLAFPDPEVQKLALECLLRRKSPALKANSDRLKNLLDSTKLRDELLQFVSDEDAGGLEPSHRDEVVPLLIRITYGIMTSRQGRASASSGQGRAGRRAAILGALGTCSCQELDTLVDLTVGPLRRLLVTPPGESFRFAIEAPQVSGKRQLGFLGLLADILKHLGKDLVHRWPELLGATLNLLHFAQKGIQEEAAAGDAVEILNEDVDDEEVNDDEVNENDEIQAAPLRHIRQLSFKRLADFFRLEAGFDYDPFVAAAFPTIISPRLPTLAGENGQAPSALLELFVTWASRRDLVNNLVKYDGSLLPALYGCLTVRNVKPAVVLRVFDIVTSLVDFAIEDGGKESEIGRTVIEPGVGVLLAQLAGLFKANASLIDAKHEVGQRQVKILCSLAPYVTSSEQATSFLTLITPMLRKANKTVPEKVKSDLLKIFTSLYPLARPAPHESLYQACYEALSSLFGSARTRGARLQLVAAFLAFASVETSFEQVGVLIQDLNSYSTKRSEEYDFDRRLAAFSLLNEDIYSSIRTADWVPVIYNMLQFIQDPEELAIRSNASFALRRFVAVAGASNELEMRTVVTKVLLPGLRNTLHAKLEIVRSEVLGVYAYAVEHIMGIGELDQLKCLLVGGDQEANFFYNIVHIQIHRRTRALRRLADEVEAGSISSKVVSDVFLPLLDHFVMGADDKKDPDLVNETVQCLGRISKHLVWSGYNKVSQHYLKLAKGAGLAQRACVRALVAVLKGFHFDLVADPRVLEITTGRLLPELLRYLEKREETDEEIRIPVAEGICAIVQHLPVEARATPESALLMTLSQILRSKDQHLRDITRTTLCNIAVAAGLDVLPNLVKELRRALQRGPQLHVLAFTVHAILVRLGANPSEVDFDGALSEIVPILGDDVFGTPSKDRASQEFRAKTKFREVRSYKSLDSFELLAQTISPSKIATLLSPIRDILQQTESSRALKEADEVFRRIAMGLTINKRLDSVGLLDLCHSLISQNANFLRPAPVGKKGRKAAPDFHVQLTRHDTSDRDFYAKNAHKFVSFGLDLFNSAYRKSQFDLDSPLIIARLEPLVSLVGNTLYADDPTILARSMRATAALIRCPLSSVEKAAPVLVRQMLSIIQRSGSTESELTQSSLRTLAIVIRDCKAATLREDQLTELLHLIGPDLEEADRQATLFQLLRSIMARKFVAPEIYDLMEKVAEILVTNQSSNIREVCRAVYLQFLLDYPQGKGRLKNSLAFVAKNLSFVHESGRLSVLELMSAILSKFATQLLQESADLFFVALVMVVANDSSTKCREMAGELVKVLFTRIEKDARDVLLAMLQTWSTKTDQPQLARTAVQLYGVVIEALGADGKAVAPAILVVIASVLEASDQALREAENQGEQTMDLDIEWQLPYQALQSLAHVYKAFPDLVAPATMANRAMWNHVQGHLLFPHIWIRTSSARLLGSLYADSGLSVPVTELPDDHPLSTPSLLDAAQKACLQLKSPLLSETLAMQIVKNLFFATKCFAERRGLASAETGSEDDDHEGGDEERTADPLRWLFTRLSFQTRAAHTSRPSMHASTPTPWSLQPATILRWFAAVISYLEKSVLESFLVQMATPIFRISEDPNAQDPQMVELQSLANEVQELLQTKIGTTAYSTVHTQIRQKVAEKRNERKTALALQAINDPAEDAKRKAKRNEQKSRQKKRKNANFADNKRGFTKRSRRDE